MEREEEILREKEIEEEMIEGKLKEAKRTGEAQEIKTEVPAGILIEKVRFKKFKRIPEVVQKMFITEDIELMKGKKRVSCREITPKCIRCFVRDKYNNFSGKDDMFAVEKIEDKDDPEKIRMKTIVYGDLSKPGNALSLFHEIGHTHIDPKLELALGKARANLEAAYCRTKKHKPVKDETLWRDTRKSEFRPVKKTLVNRFMELQAREERDAWAYALRSLRKLRKEGLDLEPGMKKLEDIEGFIYGKIGLGGYALDVIERTGASKMKEELLPIIRKFTK